MKDVIKTDVAQMIADAQKEALTQGRKNINQAVKNINQDVKTESKETTMKTKVKDMFEKMAEKNPRLAKALKTIKKGSCYLVKNYVASVFGVALFPAIIVGGVCIIGLIKYKGGKYVSNKKAISCVIGVTAAVAVASVATICIAGTVTGLLVAAAVSTAFCLAVEGWSWFKNRKSAK